MSLPLISFEEYKESLGRKNLFNGHFWTTDGDLFEVRSSRMTTRSNRPSSPFENHPGCLNRDTVYANEKKKIKITLKEIGDKDVVYDEDGDFVGTRPGHNPERKGVIYIRKKIKKDRSKYPPGKSYEGQDPREYEDLPFKSAEAKTNLKAEAYSKIFTHILEMDSDIKKDLKWLRNGKVSVEIELGGTKTFHNLPDNYEYKGLKHANAYADAKNNVLVAMIGAGVANADDNYATIWNILSLLGVHEMKHVIFPWMGDKQTHHLNYMFQKAHHTWENTTPSFKKGIDETLKTKYYREYEKAIDKEPLYETYQRYREFGIFPPVNGRFEDIESQLIDIVKDDKNLKELDDYFRRYKEYKGYKKYFDE